MRFTRQFREIWTILSLSFLTKMFLKLTFIKWTYNDTFKLSNSNKKSRLFETTSLKWIDNTISIYDDTNVILRAWIDVCTTIREILTFKTIITSQLSIWVDLIVTSIFIFFDLIKLFSINILVFKSLIK